MKEILKKLNGGAMVLWIGILPIKNVNFPQIDLKVEGNCPQIPETFFEAIKKKTDSKIYIEMESVKNRQGKIRT